MKSVKAVRVNVSVSVILDRIRLVITNKDLPNYKFDDVYASHGEALVAVNRTVHYHEHSSELMIKLTRENQD